MGLGVWQLRRFVNGRPQAAEPPAPTQSPGATPAPRPTPTPTAKALSGFDVVLAGGRVIDPETGFDEIANVGIKGSTIATISDRPLIGKKVIDARGLVVSPGFIDNLCYEPNEFGVWYKIADGITTTLGMHGLDGSANSFFRNGLRNRWPLHYGGAFDDPWWRTTLGLGASGRPSSSQRRELARLAEREIRNGWIGIDVEPEYSPGITLEEQVALGRIAAKYDMPVCSHVRYSDDESPGTEQQALAELIDVAEQARCAVHVQHINSTGGTFTLPARLAQIQKARDAGLDVTACQYPYNFWSTFLGSARFAGGWQERFNISYGDLELPGTGERLTESSFRRYRSQNRVVVAYAIPEQTVRTAFKSDLVMFGSDTILIGGVGRHPRGAGSASRILGHYVRDEKALSLQDALKRLTIMPAKRVEAGAPQMKKKGRLQEGMDADITLFDPDTIIDRATVRNPAQYSRGVSWVLVMGRVVKDPQGLNKSERHGTPIVSTPALAAGKHGTRAA